MTPEEQLISAAKKGDIKTVKTLLKSGADIHANNNQALRLVSRGGKTQTVQLLLQHGTNIHENNDAALQEAAINGYTQTVQPLLNHGANTPRRKSQIKKSPERKICTQTINHPLEKFKKTVETNKLSQTEKF